MTFDQNGNKADLKSKFDKLLAFKSVDDRMEHNAKMLVAQFINVINDVMDKRKITRKMLAKNIGTSGSFISQVFRGDKYMNFMTLAKIQEALGIEFQIKMKTNGAVVNGAPRKSINGKRAISKHRVKGKVRIKR